jgi:hypothetical protein
LKAYILGVAVASLIIIPLSQRGGFAFGEDGVFKWGSD